MNLPLIAIYVFESKKRSYLGVPLLPHFLSLDLFSGEMGEVWKSEICFSFIIVTIHVEPFKFCLKHTRAFLQQRSLLILFPKSFSFWTIETLCSSDLIQFFCQWFFTHLKLTRNCFFSWNEQNKLKSIPYLILKDIQNLELFWETI